jgi:murein DD-endopeptidase MepM/ murein hydrolase activator NlpD
MSKAFLRTTLICLSLLAAEAAPKFTWAGGSIPEDSAGDDSAAVFTDPVLDAHERQARAFAAALARSRALQEQASLTSLPGDPTERMRPGKVWTQSQIVAQRRRLALPASGEIHRGYDRRARHYGVDIVLEANAPIFAAADGVVVHAGWDNTGYGRMVWLDHGNGLRTLYAHLNAVLVERGQIVLQGQQVGRAGSSGHSTGPHLHFEVKQDMVKLDPLAFFPDGRAPLEEEFVVATSPSRSEEKRQ